MWQLRAITKHNATVTRPQAPLTTDKLKVLLGTLAADGTMPRINKLASPRLALPRRVRAVPLWRDPHRAGKKLQRQGRRHAGQITITHDANERHSAMHPCVGHQKETPFGGR